MGHPSCLVCLDITSCRETRISNQRGDRRHGDLLSFHMTSSRVFLQIRETWATLHMGRKNPIRSSVTTLGWVVSRSSSSFWPALFTWTRVWATSWWLIRSRVFAIVARNSGFMNASGSISKAGPGNIRCSRPNVLITCMLRGESSNASTLIPLPALVMRRAAFWARTWIGMEPPGDCQPYSLKRCHRAFSDLQNAVELRYSSA